MADASPPNPDLTPAMLGGGARGVLPPSPAPSGAPFRGRIVLVAGASFATGAWTSVAISYRMRPTPSAVVVFLSIVCVVLILATLFWVRAARMFMQSREYWRARAWAATRPEDRPAWWSKVPW